MEHSTDTQVKDTTVTTRQPASLSFLLRLDRLNSNMVTLADQMRVLMSSLSRHMVEPSS